MIKYLYIKNFRSIKELELFPENLCSLLGPNSVGKTNVLKALDLLLGESWATKGKISFSTPIKYSDNYGREIVAEGVQLRMTLRPELTCKVSTTPDGKFLSEDFKKKCHFIYIPSQRELSDQMRVTGWTLLGKLMKEVHANYIAAYGGDEEKLKAELKEIIKPAKEFIEKDFDPSATTFSKFVETFKRNCVQNSVGLANKFEPELNIYNLNWFYKTLQIQVTEKNGQVFDAEDLGSGLQNLILISIFQTYAELMGGRVIFGIEEPEIYLYPQAQRALYESFQELSKNGQIFYTTHNPNFVSAFRAHEIEILQKDDEKGTYVLDKNSVITKDFLQDTQYKIYSHFNTHRNEIFFAKKTLLVEGPSDKILWETLCKEKWGIDLNRSGISIIDCSGKGGVIYFTGVCKLLGLNYFSVWDGDDEAPHELLAEAQTSGRGLEIEGNLEKFLKSNYADLIFSKDEAKKIQQAHEWAEKTTEWPAAFEPVKIFLSDPVPVVSETPVVPAQPVEPDPLDDIFGGGEDDINPDDIPF